MSSIQNFLPIIAGFISIAASVQPASANGPSFDCARASTATEKLICTNGQLSELDRETARLFTLARDGAGATSAQREELVSQQKDWLNKRENCGAVSEPHRCAADLMVTRIGQLREQYPDARQRDSDGISLGPFSARCEAYSGKLDVTYVNSTPSFAYVSEPGGSFILKQAISGSGARYDSAYPAGKGEVWTKGNGAQITLPGRPEMTCVLNPPK